MKYCILTSLLLLYTINTQAQPVITNAEKYKDGVTYFRMYIDDNKKPVQAAGVNQIWDYSWLSDTGYVEQYKYDQPVGWPRQKDDIVAEWVGRNKWYYYDVTSTATYYTGQQYIASEFGGTFKVTDTLSKSRLVSPHVLRYGDMIADTIPRIDPDHINVMLLHADAYGTLILPNDTFSNVLRVERRVVFIDTDTLDTDTPVTASYKWYVNDYPLPVLEVSRYILNSGPDTTYSGKYFMFEKSLTINKFEDLDNITAHINNEELLIKGEFEPAVIYRVRLLSMTGQIVYNKELQLGNGMNRLSLGGALPSANYILYITDTNTQSSTQLKLHK